MSTKNLRKLVKNAMLGRFGRNWIYVGKKANEELKMAEAESKALRGDLACASCGNEIDIDEEFITDYHDDHFHKKCFDDDRDAFEFGKSVLEGARKGKVSSND